MDEMISNYLETCYSGYANLFPMYRNWLAIMTACALDCSACENLTWLAHAFHAARQEAMRLLTYLRPIS